MNDVDPAQRGFKLSPGFAVKRRLILTWIALTWERLWIRLWRPVSLAGVFVALALTDILAALPLITHAIVVLFAIAALAVFTIREFEGFIWPNGDETRARLQIASPVRHRPLTTVEDSLATSSDPVQQQLWRRHQLRAVTDLVRLRAPWPRPRIALRDQFALRVLVILVLFVALVGGVGSVGDRLLRAFIPHRAHGNTAVAVKLWVTPPAYTGRAPLYFELPSKGALARRLDIAAGSKVLVVATGTNRDMALVLDDKKIPLDRLADASQRADVTLTPAKRLELREGSATLAGWDTTWIPDMPPTVAFTALPGATARGQLQVPYRANDDYGVQDVTLDITRADDDGASPGTMPDVIEVPLPLPPFAPKAVNQTTTADLASHPWAGLKVKLQLKATDQAAQIGLSDPIVTILPERVFTHPVARELAKWRRALITDAASNARPAHESVGRILEKPESFGGDAMVVLLLTTAKARLGDQTPAEALKTVPETLWRAAVRIEDGDLMLAEQRLDEAEKALREAIKNNAAPEEIDRRIAELQKAMNEYARAQAEKQGSDSDMANADRTKSPEDLAEMVKKLRDLADMGSKEEAEQMLSELEQRLQEMRAQNGSGSDSQQLKAAQQLLKDMRRLANEQSSQLDRNFDAARNGSQRKTDPSDQNAARQASQAASSQESLRQQLSSVMDRMKQMTGRNPEDLEQAGDAMGEARDELKAQEWRQALDSQGKALAKLQQGAEQGEKDIMQALRDQSGSGQASEGSQFRSGDRSGQRVNSEHVDIPNGPDTEGMASRVRAILEEIRNRASDRTRSESEQDYLKRLMQPY